MVIKVDHKASLNARNMIFTLSHIPLWCKRVLSKIQNVYGTRQGSRITCASAPLEIIFEIKIRLNHYKTIWKSNWNSSRQKHCSTKRIFVVCTQSEIVDFRVRRSPNALLNYVIISSKSSRITKLIRHGFLLQWGLDLDLDFFPIGFVGKKFPSLMTIGSWYWKCCWQYHRWEKSFAPPSAPPMQRSFRQKQVDPLASSWLELKVAALA